MDFDFNNDAIQRYLAQQTTKPGRRLIWNSYAQGTYVKAKHGPIGSKIKTNDLGTAVPG